VRRVATDVNFKRKKRGDAHVRITIAGIEDAAGFVTDELSAR
jgi:hypothetical protein